MAWTEAHQALGRHPKLLKLAGMLRVHRAQALGHLQYLWWWALDYAPTGDVSALTPAEISAASEWQGEPSLFQKSLKACGWLDEDGMIHDWMQYAGRLVEARRMDAERKRASRIVSAGHPPDILPPSRVPNSTQPNSTNPTQQTKRGYGGKFAPPTLEEVKEHIRSKGYSVDPERWFAFYESNGWRVGKNPMKNWKAAVVTWTKNDFQKGGHNGKTGNGFRVGAGGHTGSGENAVVL
jgi:hypothetical protein